MTVKTRKAATIADLITAEAAKSFEVWDEVAVPESVSATPADELSQSPVFLFIAAAVAILVMGKAFVYCAVLAFNLGRKAVNAAIDARAPKIDFAVYQPIFEGLES